MINLIQKFKSEEGFGLVEVLVGTVMLLFTATAALTLSHQVTRSETFNEKRMVAYNLAQWAMEDIRKTRDSMWDDIQAEDSRWGEQGFWEQKIYDDLEKSPYSCASKKTDGAYLLFEKCQINDENSNTTEENYNLKVKISDMSDVSILNGQGANRIDDSLAKRVEVVVEWNERGTDVKNLKLTSMLTDWNYLHEVNK